MTGTEVGKLIGTSAITIYRYETNQRKLPVSVAKKLGQIYGVPWERFYDDEAPIR